MSDSLLVMSHGLDSSPLARKIQWLKPLAEAAGWQVLAPDYGDDDPAARIDQLVAAVQEAKPKRCVLSGSSMGGVVSVLASQRLSISGLFLMVPAVHWPGYETLDYSVEVPVIEVVHAWHDDVVPLERVQRWAEVHQAPLHILNDGHRLENSRANLELLFGHFLERLKQS